MSQIFLDCCRWTLSGPLFYTIPIQHNNSTPSSLFVLVFFFPFCLYLTSYTNLCILYYLTRKVQYINTKSNMHFKNHWQMHMAFLLLCLLAIDIAVALTLHFDTFFDEPWRTRVKLHIIITMQLVYSCIGMYDMMVTTSRQVPRK